jgi:hypothetical protein
MGKLIHGLRVRRQKATEIDVYERSLAHKIGIRKSDMPWSARLLLETMARDLWRLHGADAHMHEHGVWQKDGTAWPFEAAVGAANHRYQVCVAKLATELEKAGKRVDKDSLLSELAKYRGGAAS